MGYMDLLKSAAGIKNDQPQQINQDGKNYTFTPGENGSLTAPANTDQKPIYEPKPSVAKAVPRQTIQVAAVSD